MRRRTSSGTTPRRRAATSSPDIPTMRTLYTSKSSKPRRLRAREPGAPSDGSYLPSTCTDAQRAREVSHGCELQTRAQQARQRERAGVQQCPARGPTELHGRHIANRHCVGTAPPRRRRWSRTRPTARGRGDPPASSGTPRTARAPAARARRSSTTLCSRRTATRGPVGRADRRQVQRRRLQGWAELGRPLLPELYVVERDASGGYANLKVDADAQPVTVQRPRHKGVRFSGAQHPSPHASRPAPRSSAWRRTERSASRTLRATRWSARARRRARSPASLTTRST